MWKNRLCFSAPGRIEERFTFVWAVDVLLGCGGDRRFIFQSFSEQLYNILEEKFVQ